MCCLLYQKTDAQWIADLETENRRLREALEDEISDFARIAGPCQAGLVRRCLCEKCRRERSRAALAPAVAQEKENAK